MGKSLIKKSSSERWESYCMTHCMFLSWIIHSHSLNKNSSPPAHIGEYAGNISHHQPTHDEIISRKIFLVIAPSTPGLRQVVTQNIWPLNDVTWGSLLAGISIGVATEKVVKRRTFRYLQPSSSSMTHPTWTSLLNLTIFAVAVSLWCRDKLKITNKQSQCLLRGCSVCSSFRCWSRSRVWDDEGGKETL